MRSSVSSSTRSLALAYDRRMASQAETVAAWVYIAIVVGGILGCVIAINLLTRKRRGE